MFEADADIAQIRAEAAARIIVALDVPDPATARDLIATLPREISTYKIGLELLYGGGLDLARHLIAEGRDVFIDAKLLDIGHTVERATAQIADLGARYLTVHASDTKTLRAAVRGRGQTRLRLLAVTVLTNLDFRDLAEQCVSRSPRDLVLHRARLAAEAGFDGVVASAQEALAIRAALPRKFQIITPGIRPAGSSRDDQSRVCTPSDAIAAGADRLVIGRPIIEASEPAASANAIIGEIAAAIAARR
jgi:orotidine-5'-phosphate decarboxylase